MSAENEVVMNIAEVVAYDPNAPMATAPVMVISEENVVAEPPPPPTDEEINFIKDINDIGDRLLYLWEEEEISDYAYEEISGYWRVLMESKFYKKVEKRMNKKVRVATPLTEVEKINHPDYRQCPKCLKWRHKRTIAIHMARNVCSYVDLALRSKGVNKMKPSSCYFSAQVA